MANNKKHSALRIARICCASVVLLAFILLFLNFGGIFDKILGWLPKLQFWPAVISLNVGVIVLLVSLTLIFGRVYCSFLCPLGISQDFIYFLRTRGAKKKRFQQEYSKSMNALRYGILGFFILATIAGTVMSIGSLVYLIEPYSIFGRMMSSLLGRSLVVGLTSLVTLAIIVFLVWKYGRTWCNTICPVGSLLGLISRFSILKLSINRSKCINCGLCGKACRASCIDTKNHRIDPSRCIDCYDCLENCSSGAIGYKFSLGRPSAPLSEENGSNAAQNSAEAETVKKEEGEGAQNGRRAFIAASALAVGTAALKAQEGHGALAPLIERKRPSRNNPLVPAGSESLNHFSRHCIGCQLCVDACPNNVLSPSLDPMRFMQPEMNFEKGFCRPECNACTRVCPAGAIKEILAEEKTTISIGHAVYKPNLCVVKTDGVDCGNCARHCPAGAISMVKSKELDGRRIPVVNPERCIGCGHCEYVCPSRPSSAIYVEGNLMHRSI